MARKKSSQSWLTRQKKDPYVAQSKQAGYRSRASFKLLEINKADKLFKPNMCVIDLGAAPGGWSQALVPILGKNGRIIAVDLLEMSPIEHVDFIQGDFTQLVIQSKIKGLLNEKPADWVISDMAPNLSGMKSIDQPRAMGLVEEAWVFARETLAPGGGLLVKVFQGEGVDEFKRELMQHFQTVVTRKPEASRSASSEIYIVAKNLIGS